MLFRKFVNRALFLLRELPVEPFRNPNVRGISAKTTLGMMPQNLTWLTKGSPWVWLP